MPTERTLPELTDLNTLETLAKRRRSIRRFRPDPLPPGLLERLLQIAHWAPSGYNLQPTHYFVVSDTAAKKRILSACMNQKQVCEAPVSVIFTGDINVVANNFEDMLKEERAQSVIDEKYEVILRKLVPMAFSAQDTSAPPSREMRTWLGKQVSLAAMNFMLAATAAGLATVPMEGFDEKLLRQTLDMPGNLVPFLVIPVGYALDACPKKTRLPLERFVHRV